MSRGRIRKALSGFYYVDVDGRTVTCRARGKFRQEGRSPLVGDWVEVKETGVGPRPALWNQDDLIRARDEYGANALVPGLTGYAQVHGRDELPIPVKAKLDGYYAQNISLKLDIQIFFRTIVSVLKGTGVVEGGTHGK